MAERPNILFLFDDQHRHDYIGAAGAGWIDTPNLDRLAAEGVRFFGGWNLPAGMDIRI